MNTRNWDTNSTATTIVATSVITPPLSVRWKKSSFTLGNASKRWSERMNPSPPAEEEPPPYPSRDASESRAAPR